jgi:hypothetical protein
MPSNKAVVDVIEQWSGQRPDKMSQILEDWWNQTAPGSSHSALQFDPDGIEDLIKRIEKAFPSAPVVEAADFRTSGNIKTVQDLVDALQPAVVSDAMDVPAMAKRIGRRTRSARKKVSAKVTGKKAKPTAKRPSVKRKSASKKKGTK